VLSSHELRGYPATPVFWMHSTKPTVVFPFSQGVPHLKSDHLTSVRGTERADVRHPDNAPGDILAVNLTERVRAEVREPLNLVPSEWREKQLKIDGDGNGLV